HANNQRLSAAPTAVTQSGSVVGTVHYMSPEQILGREVDFRSDLFSLGVVLCEMVTGHLPFAGVSLGETMDHIIHAEPDGIADIEPKLAHIVRKCLEKDPGRRYASAYELLQDLQAMRPVDKISTGRNRVLRSRWSIGAAAFAIALTIIVVRWLRETPHVL